jgi:hypothetical protein
MDGRSLTSRTFSSRQRAIYLYDELVLIAARTTLPAIIIAAAGDKHPLPDAPLGHSWVLVEEDAAEW